MSMSLSPLKAWTRTFGRSRYLFHVREAGRPSSGIIIIIPTRNYSVVHLRPRPPFQPRPPSPAMTSPLTTTSATPDASAASPSNKTVRVVIKGRVQGVFYRDWTVENATQLGLKGWVRNRRDGSVEALFSGDADKVQEMEQRCRRGPCDALVTGLQVFPSDDDPETQFKRKQTNPQCAKSLQN